ncbi:cytochrome P450 [Halenospora varia]|nr:cytochrome P450 [Halenospora varia]
MDVYPSVTELVKTRPLISVFLVGCATHIIYTLAKKYLEYRADTAFGRRHGCEPPPELTKKWFLGIDRIKELWDSNREGRLLSFLCSIAKDYEPRNNLSQFLLVGPRAFHVLHPKNLESVLATNFGDYGFGVRQDIFAPLLGNGIFTQEGPAWKHSRELLRKQFIQAQYQNLDHFREHVDNLVAHLPADGVVDLQPLFFNLTLDTTTALLFGRSVYSLRANIDQDNDNKLFAESFNIALEGLAKRFRIAPWHFFYNPSDFRQACANVHRFVEGYIEERNLGKQKGDVHEESYGFINQVAEESESTEDLRDQLLNVLLAGRDTTACCLSWIFRLLIRHPQAMHRLRMEVFSVMGNSDQPNREQIRKMPFLSYVIKESLRLYPPVPLNNRTVNKTTILPTGGGPDGHSPILVRKGELVVFSSYVNSRRKNIYGPDADEFHPERWENGGLSGIGWAYFPFSGGPRQCLGEDFALMETSYTIVRLLQSSSSICLPLGEVVEPVGMERQRLTLVLSSADGCRVHIKQ